MKALFRLKIKHIPLHYFVELSKELNISFVPRKGDYISIDEFENCEIESVYIAYDSDDDEQLNINFEYKYPSKSEKPQKEVIEILKSDMQELKERGWEEADYYFGGKKCE